MKQLNNNTFGKNSWSRHWEKLCFLRNTLEKNFWSCHCSHALSVMKITVALQFFYFWVKWEMH